MSRFSTYACGGLLIALAGAFPAAAQTSAVAHLTDVSGNGEVACLCEMSTLQLFTNNPISVRATDVNNRPVVGATVTWTLTSGQMTLGSPTSVTDVNGLATNTMSLVVIDPFENSFVQDIVNTIQATSNSQSVVFTETQSLTNINGQSVIIASIPTYGGVNFEGGLTGNAGSIGSTPIQEQVAGPLGYITSGGVPNVSVSLFNLQATPTVTCANTTSGTFADPGSVLTAAQSTSTTTYGYANCYPAFNGSGNGSFWVVIGAAPGGGSNFANAQYLEAFGPFTFTSFPGNPTAIRIISGNNQVAAVGATLQPMIAELVDAAGNPVQGQTILWTVTPRGAAVGNTDTSVTDNNGQVSNTFQLFQGAAAGVAISVALQGNSSISASFQVSIQGSFTALNKISGDSQSAQQGTTFAKPLVVQLLSSAGGVANYGLSVQVNGPVSIVGGNTVPTNTSGQASMTVQAGNSAGPATVTVFAGALSQTFNLTVTSTPTSPPPTGMTIVSGNPQTAVEFAAFTSPLVVQVTDSSGADSGVVVNFTSSGPVSISSAAATTNSSGQASINVTAGGSPGQATVTASISGGFSQTFNLTVTLPGPVISPASFLNAASRQGGALSPCSLAIIAAQGLLPNGLNSAFAAPIFGPLPKSMDGLSVTIGGYAAPVVSAIQGVNSPEVTVQVPCEVAPAASVPVVVNVAGGGNATTNIPISSVSPGIFQTVMSDGVSRAVAVRDDGSFADIGGKVSNPIRLGENVRFYLTGLGMTAPSIGTNSIQDPNADLFNLNAMVQGTVVAGIVGGPGLNVISARPAPDLIGVYEVQVNIPNSAPIGNSVQLSIGIVPFGAPSSSQGIYAPNALITIGQ